MKKSFSMIELIIAILIIGILAAIAVPKMISFKEEAELAAEQKILGGVRSGISIYYIESAVQGRAPLFPQELDNAGFSAVSVTNPFFTNLLSSPGLIDGDWQKLNATSYRGPSGAVYNYDSIKGTFLE